MTVYNREQMEALLVVREGLKRLRPSVRRHLRHRIRRYLVFRKEVDAFLDTYFLTVCTQKCFQDRYSACCGREGITTFFADVVINALVSSEGQLDGLLQALRDQGPEAPKCVYLGSQGCLWQVKPIVCQMFLCRPARETVFGTHPEAQQAWGRLEERKKRYTWPTRPVLFESLEDFFREQGLESSLMYFHNSPGLLRIRAQREKRVGQ